MSRFKSADDFFRAAHVLADRYQYKPSTVTTEIMLRAEFMSLLGEFYNCGGYLADRFNRPILFDDVELVIKRTPHKIGIVATRKQFPVIRNASFE